MVRTPKVYRLEWWNSDVAETTLQLESAIGHALYGRSGLALLPARAENRPVNNVAADFVGKIDDVRRRPAHAQARHDLANRHPRHRDQPEADDGHSRPARRHSLHPCEVRAERTNPLYQPGLRATKPACVTSPMRRSISHTWDMPLARRRARRYCHPIGNSRCRTGPSMKLFTSSACSLMLLFVSGAARAQDFKPSPSKKPDDATLELIGQKTTVLGKALSSLRNQGVGDPWLADA